MTLKVTGPGTNVAKVEERKIKITEGKNECEGKPLKLKQAEDTELKIEGLPGKAEPVVRDGLLTDLFENSEAVKCPMVVTIVKDKNNNDKSALSEDENA